ncbi:MAG: hypothetical protein JWL77_6371 [Chthonomonadaceae bacterium]|nr:hypothetical protein [Chthonomonadaceae bacterium]
MPQNNDPRPSSSFADRPRAVQPTPPQSTHRRPRFWRRVRRGLAGALLLSVAAFCVANVVTSWLLHRELTAVVQRGEPLRIGALVPPSLPALQNAAPVYLRAAAALTLTRSEEEELRSTKATGSHAELLAKNQTAIQLTRQAAEFPTCRFPVDYDATNMAGILLPHLGKMQRLADVIRAQAEWEAQQGQTDAALNDVAVLFRMSEHLAPEPLLISGVITMAIERKGYTALAHVLNEVSLSPEQAHVCALRLSHIEWTATLRQDLRGERCFGLWAFRYISNPVQASQLLNGPSAPSFDPGMKVLSVLWSPFWKMDEIQYLRAIDRRSEEFQYPGTPLISDDAFTNELPRYAICSRVMLPALPPVARKRDQLLVYRRMALVALALHAYRTSQGRYPPDLNTAESAWGAALPRDLSTDQPFLYKTDGETMSLSSVGSHPKELEDKKEKRTRADDGSADSADDLAW